MPRSRLKIVSHEKHYSLPPFALSPNDVLAVEVARACLSPVISLKPPRPEKVARQSWKRRREKFPRACGMVRFSLLPQGAARVRLCDLHHGDSLHILAASEHVAWL